MNDRYPEIIQYLSGLLNTQVWAVTPRAQWAVREEFRGLLSGRRSTDEEVRNRILGLGYDDEPARAQPMKMTAGVAIIRVDGFLFPEPNICTYYGWGTALSDVAQKYRQAVADQSVGSIVLWFNSPGGSIVGGEELWNELFAARAAKRALAQVSYTAGSLAYLLATALAEIVVAPSAEVGSIGCYAEHEDLSKMMEELGIKHTYINSSVGPYKLEGNPYEPLGEEAKAHLLGEVDAFGQFFVRAGSKGRGTSTADVLKNFGQGRMVRAREAVTRGMADRIGTIEETVAKLAGKRSGARADATGRPFVAVETEAAEADVTVLNATTGKPPVAAQATPPEVTTAPIQPDPTGAAERERARAALDLIDLG